MPSSYTSSLRLTLPATGELSGSWGSTVNTGITELLDAAVAGTASISTWGGAGVAYTLSSTNGAADEARKMFIVASGSPGEAKNVICPAVSKFYVFRNDTTGGYALTLKTGSGTGISVPAGQYRFLYCDGTNVVEAFNSAGALTLGTALAASSGGTGQSTYTAGDLIYATGATTLAKLGIGASTTILTSSGSAPQWSSSLTLSGTLAVNGNTTLGDASTDTVTISGRLGFGNAPNTNTGIYYRPTSSTITGSTTGIGLYMDVPFASDVTSSANAAYFRVNTAASAYTVSTAIGLRLLDAIKGAGSTITNQFGLSVTDQTQGTNNYGISSEVSSGTNKWNIYASGTAANYFAGNVGIGAAASDSAWASTKVVNIGRLGNSVFGTTNDDEINIGANVINTGSGTYIYGATDTASLYRQVAAQHVWYYAGSGTAGAALTLTEAMRINASGNVGIGTSSLTYRLEVGGTASGANNVVVVGPPSAVSGYSGLIQFRDDTAARRWAVGILQQASATALSFYDVVASAERLRIDSSGNLGLGVTPSAWGTGQRFLQFGARGSLGQVDSGNVRLGYNYFSDGTNYIYIASTFASAYQQSSGNHAWYTAPSGTAGNTISFVQAMTLDASGNLGVGIAAPVAYTTNARTLHIDGGANSAQIRLTNNTTGSAQINGGLLSMDGNQLAVWNVENDVLRFGTNDTERARITSDGYLRMASGSLGIQFNGDTAAANALDDYEEGTFTPAVEGTTTAGTGTYATRSGKYTKIGNVVYFSIYLNLTAHTGTGNMVVTGLPFTAYAASADAGLASLDYINGALTVPANSIPIARVNPSLTTVFLYSRSTAGTITDAALALDAVTAFTLTGFYYV